ncbi:MAG: DUF427 domain-containing protein [Pseudomonadota bacterium]|nr:DUF427 domain-containing protein [Pseudomonadota bacterium]
MGQAVNSIGESIDPAHTIHIQPSGKHVTVEFGGKVIADSLNTLALKEADYPEMYYFPVADVHMEFLQPTTTSTHCPYKGDASYWSIRTGQKALNDGAWSYRQPLKERSEIKGLIAFYADKMDRFVIE